MDASRPEAGMGLSETIIAASIGAAATICTALFQLFSALRTNSGRPDTRQKKGSTVKSIVAVVVLMMVSGVSGYLFSEFRSERTANDMHSMRDDINAKLQILAETTSRLAARDNAGANIASAMAPIAPAQVVSTTVESVIFAPACQAGASCTEANSQPMALCGAIPSSMQARKFELFIKGASSTEVSKVDFGQDLGGAKFSGPPVEYPEGDNRKAVCVNFLHWSEQPHIATLVVQFGTSVEIGPTTVQQTPVTSVLATQPSPGAHTVSMTQAATP
jgi:hypothetical protein